MLRLCYDSVLSLPGTQVQSLVGKLRSYKPQGAARKIYISNIIYMHSLKCHMGVPVT